MRGPGWRRQTIWPFTGRVGIASSFDLCSPRAGAVDNHAGIISGVGSSDAYGATGGGEDFENLEPVRNRSRASCRLWRERDRVRGGGCCAGGETARQRAVRCWQHDCRPAERGFGIRVKTTDDPFLFGT